MTQPVYQNFIDGRYMANASGESFEVINPGTGQCNTALKWPMRPSNRRPLPVPNADLPLGQP